MTEFIVKDKDVLLSIDNITKYKENLIDNSGIYGISVNDVLVYIGKSYNLYSRFKQHIKLIHEPNKERKYLLLNKYYTKGYNIDFIVLELCDYERLNELESYYINKYLPFLNHEIPKYKDNKMWIKSIIDFEELHEDKIQDEIYCYINCDRNFDNLLQFKYECDYALCHFEHDNIIILYDTKYESRDSYKKSLNYILKYIEFKNFKVIKFNSKNTKELYKIIDLLKNKRLGIINFSTINNALIKTFNKELSSEIEYIQIEDLGNYMKHRYK